MNATARASLVVLCLLPLLAACGHRAGATGVVQLWAMGREGEVVQALLPEFERRHPGVRVRVQQIPWSAAHEKLLTAYAGGAMPDVFQLGNTWVAELVALRALEPLDARLAAATGIDRSDYFPGILATNVVGGTTWALPWYVDTRLLFYRSDRLARAGLAGMPRTRGAWIEALRRLARAAAPGEHAILLPPGEWEVPIILALGDGAPLLRDGDRYGDFRGARFRGAFARYVDLFREGLAVPPGVAQPASLHQGFARGDFAMFVSGPWNLEELARRLPADLQARWATAPMPGADAAHPGTSIAGGASLAISRSSTRKAEAWQLVEFLSEPAQQAAFHRLTGDLPARRSAWRAAGLDADGKAAAFYAQLGAVAPLPRIPEWERIAATVARYSELAVRGDLGVDAALAGMDRDVDALLEKRRWLLARGVVPGG